MAESEAVAQSNEQSRAPDRFVQEEREAIAKVKAANARAVKDSRESVWHLKAITFYGQQKKIITQNYNGCVATYLSNVWPS